MSLYGDLEMEHILTMGLIQRTAGCYILEDFPLVPIGLYRMERISWLSLEKT